MEAYENDADWRTKTATCNRCGWEGVLESAQTELYRDCFELLCPVCENRLQVVVGYPTLLSESAREKLREDWQASLLKDTSQLPDIMSDEIIIIWDQEVINYTTWIVLTYGAQPIYREIVFYGRFERFEEIVAILKRKYGARLRDVVITKNSEEFLFGDQFYYAAKFVEAVRKRIREEKWRPITELTPEKKGSSVSGGLERPGVKGSQKLKNRMKIYQEPSRLIIQISMDKQWVVLGLMFVVLVSMGSCFPQIIPRIFMVIYQWSNSLILPIIFGIACFLGFLFLTYIWLWKAFGKEIITLSKDSLMIERNIGSTQKFLFQEISNLRVSDQKSGWGFSGGTISFECDGITYRFGIHLAEEAAQEVVARINAFIH